MKKFCMIALSLVLTASLFTGCRDRNQPMETTRPTTAPTTHATTVPTTEATRPTTQPTQSTQPSETVDHGNGPLEGMETTEGMIGTDSTEAPTGEGRSARPMPKN